MRHALIVALAAAAFAASPAAAVSSYLFGYSPSGSQTLTFNGTNIGFSQHGWFDQSGNHNAGNNNYYVGAGELRDYFVTDAAPGATIVSIDIGNNGGSGLSFGSGVTAVTWTLYDVNTLTQSDISANIDNTNFSGRTDVFNDLGTGTVYGSIVLTGPTGNVHVNLNAAGIAAYNAAGLAGNQFIFGGTLTDGITAAVPEPASWALMITGFGFVGIAARRRRSAVGA